MQVMMNKLQAAMEEMNPDFEAVYFDTGNQQISMNSTQISSSPNFHEMIYNNNGDYNFETVQESLAPISDFVEAQAINFEQYPYLMDILRNPHDKEMANQALNYYQDVLTNLEQMYSNAISAAKN